MRALCTADNHVGKHAARLSRTPGERLAEQAAIWQRTLELARDREVDVILHAGDLFDARQPDPDVFTAVERPLVEHRAVGGPPVVFCLGNHERRGDKPTAPGVLGLAGLIDFHDRPSVVEHAGVAIVCLPSVPVSRMVAGESGGDRAAIHQDAAEMLLEIARGYRAEIDGPAVLLCHFPISGDADGLSTHIRETVIPLDGLEDLGYEAIVAGDFHRPQMLETSIGRAPGPIFYCGSPQPLDFGEGGYEHGVWLLDIDGRGWQTLFLPIESHPFVTIDAELVGRDLSVDPQTALGEVIDAEAVAHGGDIYADAYVKFRYTATEEQARRIDTAALRQELLDAGAHAVWIEPTIERETRARVAGMDETVSDAEALDRWIESQPHAFPEARNGLLSALHERHTAYLEEIQR